MSEKTRVLKACNAIKAYSKSQLTLMNLQRCTGNFFELRNFLNRQSELIRKITHRPPNFNPL